MSKNVFYMLNKKNCDKLNLDKKHASSQLLFKIDFEQFDFDFKNMLGWTNYPNYCFATIIDDKIVSCASAGYCTNKLNDNVIEVTIKTHNDYQGKGYATSNLVALCEYAMNMQENKEIHYVTGIDNIPAQKAAMSVGLIKTQRNYILLRKLISRLRRK